MSYDWTVVGILSFIACILLASVWALTYKGDNKDGDSDSK